jgi:enolase
MSKIKSIKARQILDSRGNPTVEVEMQSTLGSIVRAAVPSGASTGSKEALELRDNDPLIYSGKSVLKAVQNINNIIAPALIGKNTESQREIDYAMLEMDGTENKSKLGANSLLGVSLALSRLGAMDVGKDLYLYLNQNLAAPAQMKFGTLPIPMMNIINGGAHASNNIDIQEFMIVPKLKDSFSRNLQAGVEVFHQLKKILSSQGHSTSVGDEGGFAPNLNSNQDVIEFILKAIEKAGYKPGENFFISLDCAANEFFSETKNKYTMNGKDYSSAELIDYYENLVAQYPIYSIEDGLHEKDYLSWTHLTEKIGKKILLVGDDLFVTNKKIFDVGIKEKQANAILIKLNQIGTLTETFETIKMAYDNNFTAIISHRSGETEDSYIADLSVATASGHIKTGSGCRSDRIAKYNQLLRIEENLDNASYPTL